MFIHTNMHNFRSLTTTINCDNITVKFMVNFLGKLYPYIGPDWGQMQLMLVVMTFMCYKCFVLHSLLVCVTYSSP